MDMYIKNLRVLIEEKEKVCCLFRSRWTRKRSTRSRNKLRRWNKIVLGCTR